MAGSGCVFAACMCLFTLSVISRMFDVLYLSTTSTHHPFAILAHSHAGRCLFKLEVLQQLDSIRVLGVLFQTALSFPGQPFREGSRSLSSGNGIDGDCAPIAELHLVMVGVERYMQKMGARLISKLAIAKI